MRVISLGVHTLKFKLEHGLDNPAVGDTHSRVRKIAELPPDLQTQYEDLLHTVWDTERRERMMDRIDAALDVEERRQHDSKPRCVFQVGKVRRVPSHPVANEDV